MKTNPEHIPKRTLYTGDKIPCIGMGTFGSDKCMPEQVSQAVAGAIRCGYRMFDCASVYGNEALIGQVFTEAMSEFSVEEGASTPPPSGNPPPTQRLEVGVLPSAHADKNEVKREELFIVSKVWNDMHGRGDVLLSLAKTLKDLQLDYVDAYFVHWPFPNYHAPGCDGDSRNPDSVPFSVEGFMETWRQMEKIHDSGLARHIGMSNMTVPKLEAVLPKCRIKPALLEMELHPSFQQSALYEYCTQRDIQPIGFSPIGSPARPERDKTPEDVVDIEIPEIVEIAKNHGVHPAIVCLKWAVQRGQIAIPFSTNETQYSSNLSCVTQPPLSDAEMDMIKSLNCDCRLIKGQVFLWESAKGWEDLWDMDGNITQ